MKHFTLAAFSAERRIAAVALFRGTHLEDMRLRHLPVDQSKASGSIRQLVTRFLQQRNPEFVAISFPSVKAGERIRKFCDVVKETANSLGIPTIEVKDSTLMSAYGHPPLKRKQHVRRAGRAIWPSLNDSKSRRAAVDASTAGLYVQTERLFSQYEAQP
jgi:hypothetical protein